MSSYFEIRYVEGVFWLVEPHPSCAYNGVPCATATLHRPFDLTTAKAMFAALGHGLNELNPPEDPEHLG